MSSGQRLPAKKEVVLALLEESDVFIHLDPRNETVRVPAWFKKQPHLVLQIGLNMPVPIRDLEVDEDAVSCTLSFNRSPFFCHIPWPAVYALVGADGRAMVWPDDIPPEVAAQAAQAAQVAEQKTKRRSHLRAVDEPSSAESEADAAVEAAAASDSDAGLADSPAEVPELSGVNHAVDEERDAALLKSGDSSEGQETAGASDGGSDTAAASESTEASEGSAPSETEEQESSSAPAKGKRALPPYLRIVK